MSTVDEVLILVLMEDTLRASIWLISSLVIRVLILVLMEDTLRDMDENVLVEYIKSLNPCSNGRYSQRFGLLVLVTDSGVS